MTSALTLTGSLPPWGGPVSRVGARSALALVLPRRTVAVGCRCRSPSATRRTRSASRWQCVASASEASVPPDAPFAQAFGCDVGRKGASQLPRAQPKRGLPLPLQPLATPSAENDASTMTDCPSSRRSCVSSNRASYVASVIDGEYSPSLYGAAARARARGRLAACEAHPSAARASPARLRGSSPGCSCRCPAARRRRRVGSDRHAGGGGTGRGRRALRPDRRACPSGTRSSSERVLDMPRSGAPATRDGSRRRTLDTSP